MNETGRVTSTARKISRSWWWRLFAVFFWLNIVLLAAALLGYCLTSEHAALGHDWVPGLERSLTIADIGRGRNIFMTLKNAAEAISHADYHFCLEGGTVHSVSLTAFFDYAKSVGLFLLIFELVVLLEQMAWGPRRARRLLRPLDHLARAARELGRSAQYAAPDNGAKLHDLQNAIRRIHPEHPEALNMGDRDLRELEDAINSLLRRMHESNRQQAQFVSDASHELRTPIAVIQGYAGMLDRWGKQDEKVLNESIAAIRSEADYMNRLVEQLLFLARGDAGRNPMNPKPMQLDDLVREVHADCLLIHREHDWQLEVKEGVECIGDWDLLKQCARILADNAAKYTPAGGQIRLRAYKNTEGVPCMEVQDCGMGVSASDASRIFDRFYRSDPARNRESGGTGLGLAIARWIAERHGGYIELLSREGLGTRMTLCLPEAPIEP